MHKSKLEEKLERLEDKYKNEEEKESDLGSVISMSEDHELEDSDSDKSDLERKIEHMIDFHKD